MNSWKKIVSILCIFGVICLSLPKKVLAGSCVCKTTGVGQLSVIQNLCDPTTEEPQCILNPATGTLGCGCVPLGTSTKKPVSVTAQSASDRTFCYGNGPDTNDPKINTALGCIPVRIDSFVTWLLPKLFGVAGGIAFLLMVYGFIMLAISGGQPDKVKGAKETITSAITGLIVSIGALFILRLIVVDIIKLPGF